MSRKRRKPKIVTNNKSYRLEDSIFYKLSNKNRLADLLDSSLQELISLAGNENYRCFTQVKNGKPRLIQEPLPKLDKIHSRVASLICRIETTDCLHSGKKGRSNISNARTHVGQGKRVITADIRSFFLSTKRNHVFDFFFKTMKCAPDVADLLSKILTYEEHIPTGSRISMPLAYLSNKKMFDEMQSTADEYEAKMTIYVDDLTFSGSKLEKELIKKIERIARKYGHKIHPSKTRFYSVNDVKLITGTAIKGNQILPRNKHLKSLNDDLTKWKISKKLDKKLKDRIIGKMTYMGSISQRYKDKARTFREEALK